MKKFVFLIGILSTSLLFAQNKSDILFEYSSVKNQIGTASFYKVINLDKAQDFNFGVYQESEDTFLCYFDLSNLIPQFQTGIMKYDVDYFCYKSSETSNPFTYAKIKNTNGTSKICCDFENRKATGELSVVGPLRKIINYKGSLNFTSTPAYELSGWQNDLWYSMRFIKPDCKEFTVCAYTVIKPNEEKVIYCGEETVNGKLCDKWELILLDKKGKETKENEYLWFEKTDVNYNLIKAEVHMNGGVFQNCIIELTDNKKYSISDWNQYVAELTETTRIKLGIPVEEK